MGFNRILLYWSDVLGGSGHPNPNLSKGNYGIRGEIDHRWDADQRRLLGIEEHSSCYDWWPKTQLSRCTSPWNASPITRNTLEKTIPFRSWYLGSKPPRMNLIAIRWLKFSSVSSSRFQYWCFSSWSWPLRGFGCSNVKVCAHVYFLKLGSQVTKLVWFSFF